jgi:glycosyltransferase involved in cell wall biosynthesis
MTRLNLRPYRTGDDPPPRSVPVSVVVLTKDEEPNIRRCLDSVAWADQVVVVDSGSSDDTTLIAKSLGADVVDQPWLGYSAQRDFALGLTLIRRDWVYFVDADEWVSPQLASEISEQLRAPSCAAFSHHVRLVFQGTWIRHCGWYGASLFIQLVDRRYTKYDGEIVGERPCVNGALGRLRNDLVDEDLKGLAAWLHKHVHYAQLQAERRGRQVPFTRRLRQLRNRNHADSRRLMRVLFKDVIFPSAPAKPFALFIYMYLIRLGFLDGRAGLRFCFYHAWYEASIAALQAESTATEREAPGHAIHEAPPTASA